MNLLDSLSHDQIALLAGCGAMAVSFAFLAITNHLGRSARQRQARVAYRPATLVSQSSSQRLPAASRDARAA